jgi:hypothetical protein
MADLKYKPVPHNRAEFLAAAGQRPGFNEACDSLKREYTVASQMLIARAHISDCAAYLTFVEIS